jgi:hypothetical protein
VVCGRCAWAEATVPIEATSTARMIRCMVDLLAS